MEESSSCDVVDVVLEGEVAVQDNSEVVGVSGGSQSGVVNSESEVVRGFGEGLGADDEYVTFVTVELEEIRVHP